MHLAPKLRANFSPVVQASYSATLLVQRNKWIELRRDLTFSGDVSTIPAPHPRSREILLIAFPALGSLFPFIPCPGEYECLSPGLLRFPGGKKVIASSLNEYALGPQEDHLSLSIQRSETASSVGDIGSPSLLSYLSHPGWALA